MKKHPCIHAFLRMSAQGFEKITWYKREDGTKFCVKAPVLPSPVQIRELMAAPFNEIMIDHKNEPASA